MKTSNNLTTNINDPRGNDQTREKSNPGNDVNSLTESIPFYPDEQAIENPVPGEISASSRFGEEAEGLNDQMERINRESEIQRKIRQNPGKPNMNHFKAEDRKQDNSMWD